MRVGLFREHVAQANGLCLSPMDWALVVRVGLFREHVAQANGLCLSLSPMDWALVMRVGLFCEHVAQANGLCPSLVWTGLLSCGWSWLGVSLVRVVPC